MDGDEKLGRAKQPMSRCANPVVLTATLPRFPAQW